MSGRKAKIIDQELLKVYFIRFFRADYNVLYADSHINMQQRELPLGIK